MLTVFTQPQAIALSRNKMMYKIKATQSNGLPYAGSGVYSELANNNNRLANGDVLTISWTEPDGNNYSVDFTAVANPIAANQIPDDSFSGTFAEYFVALKYQLETHPELTLKFRFNSYSDSPTIWFLRIQAIDAVVGWTVTFDISNIANQSGLTVTDNNAVVSNTTPVNHKVLLEVVFQPSYNVGPFQLVAQTENTIDENGFVQFNIEDILHAELEHSVGTQLPPFGNNTPLIADNVRNYFVRFTESFGNPAVAQDWIFSPVKQVLYGGESVERHAISQFFNRLSASNSLLTWYPDQKTVSKDAPEYLPWINYTGGFKQVYLKVELFDESSTNPVATLNKFNTGGLAGSAQKYQSVLMPVGYNQLNLHAEPFTIRKYRVQLFGLDDDTAVSQARTYYVDHCFYRSKTYLMYLNGFNVPLTVRLVGAISEDLKVERKKSTRIQADNTDLLTGEYFQHDQKFETTYTYRTGYLLKRNEVQALQELLIYNRVFELFSDGYRRIDLLDKKYKITESFVFLHSLQFKARPSINMRSYSNYLIPVSDEDQLCGPDNWTTATDQCWRTADGINWQLAT